MSDLHSFDPYHVFIATAHALRRRAERGALAMGATFGVAAEPLPFQIATVTHILSDQRIRHLIADEVGLGKTIQAIMVLNAILSAGESSRLYEDLVYRDQLAPGTGMLFLHDVEEPLAYWMKNTRIPLDIFYFDSQRRLVSSSTFTAWLAGAARFRAAFRFRC